MKHSDGLRRFLQVALIILIAGLNETLCQNLNFRFDSFRNEKAGFFKVSTKEFDLNNGLCITPGKSFFCEWEKKFNPKSKKLFSFRLGTHAYTHYLEYGNTTPYR